MISPLTWPDGLGLLNAPVKSVGLGARSHRLKLRLQSSALKFERRVANRVGRPVIWLTRDRVACLFPQGKAMGGNAADRA
jgi:hypothetical protein